MAEESNKKSSDEQGKRAFVKKVMRRPGSPIKGFKSFMNRRRPAISEVVREPTAGGVVYRVTPDGNKVQFLLIQDAKDRWTIPKGHIEEGEDSRATAIREIGEETGLKHLDVKSWLGKINFRYRRQTSLVLMTTEIFLVHATKDTNALVPEDWMNGIRWFDAHEALDKIEYEDISKLMLIALTKVKKGLKK